jgi:hypothetical protein
VISYYSQAGAFPAARRFYLRARTNFLDTVAVSQGIGQSAFVLGYCLHDPQLRQLALEDSASASSGDMMLHIWDAALRNDRTALKEITEEMIERYEPKAGADSRARRLREFLPLLDALVDAAHPRHKEAIDHFGNYNGWVFLRWIWIEKFKLSKEDAIAFLGGREASPAVHPLVCALEQDVEGATKALDEMINKNDLPIPMMVLATYTCRKAAKQSLDTAVPDLMPRDATPTRSAVLARLEATRR